MTTNKPCTDTDARAPRTNTHAVGVQRYSTVTVSSSCVRRALQAARTRNKTADATDACGSLRIYVIDNSLRGRKYVPCPYMGSSTNELYVFF